MAECVTRNECIGFLDPMLVVKYCVFLLRRDVYPNMVWTKFDIECSKAKPREPCAGIKLYLDRLDSDPAIVQEVRYFINHPCKDEMKRAINKCSKNALVYMLEYLKLRGSFISWKIDNNSTALNSVSKTRCIIRFATSYLETLPEPDHCAAVCLGRYLQYLLSVSYAHDMYFMKEVLSKLYGPIFIEMVVCKEFEKQISPKKGIEYSVMIFKKMLETCPWHQYTPMESVTRSLYPSNKREFTHKYIELAQYIYDTTTLPSNLKDNLGEIMYQQKISSPDDCIRSPDIKPEDKCYRPVKSENIFLPDSCNINFNHVNTEIPKVLT